MIPKTLSKYAHKIADYSDERASGSGIHISYRAGWKSWTDQAPTHGDVVDTVKDALYHVRNAETCDCADCGKLK